MEYDAIFYVDMRGRCPTTEYLDALLPKVRGKAVTWIGKLKEHGPNLPRPYADMVQSPIRELRVIFASDHHRFLYFFSGKTAVITHGFFKKGWEVPRSEIERALRLMNDFHKQAKEGRVFL